MSKTVDVIKADVAKAKRLAAAASAESKHLTAQLKVEAAKIKVERLENQLARTQDAIVATEAKLKELKNLEVAQQTALTTADEALEAATAKVAETGDALAAITRG